MFSLPLWLSAIKSCFPHRRKSIELKTHRDYEDEDDKFVSKGGKILHFMNVSDGNMGLLEYMLLKDIIVTNLEEFKASIQCNEKDRYQLTVYLKAFGDGKQDKYIITEYRYTCN